MLAAVLTLAVALGGVVYYRSERGALRAAIHREIETVADLKLRQLVDWRNERMSDARFFTYTPGIAKDIGSLIENPRSPALRSAAQGWLQAMKGGARYESLLLVDRQMNVLAAVPEGAPAPRGPLTQTLERVFQSREVLMTDLHRPQPDQPVHLELAAPIFASGKGAALGNSAHAAPIAAVVLRIQPERFLFPLLQDWPAPSATAETVLARRDGEEVVFINQLRHYTGEPLTLRRSANDNLATAMATRGERGVREAPDYRGVPVLAAMRNVPGTPWVMVAKMDQSEAYDPVRKRALSVAVWVAALVMSIAGAAAYALRVQHEQLLRHTLAAETHARTLSERLALITRYANDIIILTDGSLRIVEANDRALAAYQFTLDEIRQLRLEQLRAPECRASFDTHRAALELPTGAIYQTIHQRKDGTTFPVEVNGRFVDIGRHRYLLGVMRDISQRQKADEALRESEERYRSLFENSHAVMLLIDPKTGAIVDANPAATQFYGWPREIMQRMVISEINTLSPAQVREQFEEARKAQRLHFLFKHRRADGTIRHVEVFSGTVVTSGRELLFSIVHDITERQAAHAALAQRMDELKRWQSATLGREARVIELKAEVNRLLAASGKPPRYPSAEEVGSAT